MDDYLAKPIQRSALLAKVEHWMAARPEPSSDEDPVGSVGFDRETFAEVVDLLGLARVQKALEEISDRLSAMPMMAEDRDELGREAHRLVSQVGVLGFNELAHACRDLEKACHGNTDLADALAAVTFASAVCLRAASDLASSNVRDDVLRRSAG
jgi:HPt (histidine-containing phosphotransfer) domain-containing protein